MVIYSILFAKLNKVVCVLKDFRTIIASPSGECTLNLSGNNGMATAGSGDVLSGILGVFCSQMDNAYDAARLGVYLHGLAGDKAVKEIIFHTYVSLYNSSLLFYILFYHSKLNHITLSVF